MKTYDDFSRPTTDTSMISPADAGIHTEGPELDEYLRRIEEA